MEGGKGREGIEVPSYVHKHTDTISYLLGTCMDVYGTDILQKLQRSVGMD